MDHMLKHITVAIDDITYHHARVWAAKRNTSISAVVRYLLQRLPGLPAAREFNVEKAASTPPLEPVHPVTPQEEAAFTAPGPSHLHA
jgi:hypothetical protein